MRIAFITQSFPPMISGAALVVQELAKQLASRGHTIIVLAASDQGQAYSSHQDGYKVVRLSSLSNPLRVNQKFVLVSQHKLVAELSAFQPDVIHTHEPLFVGLPALIYGNRASIPVLFTTHQLPWIVHANSRDINLFQKMAEGLLWFYGSWYMKRCTSIIAPTRTIASYLEAKTGCKAYVVSSSVDLTVFKPDPDSAGEKGKLYRRYGLDPDLPVILHVGRLDIDKQVQIVIKAAAQVMRSIPAQVLVVGDGTQRRKLIKLAADSGLGTHYHFPGFVTKETDLPGLYRLAKVFVTASEIETQGIVLLEAAASGLPIVAVRATCIHEIVHEGVNGYLVSPGEADLLAERITWMLQHPHRGADMGSEGRCIAALHTIESTISKYETVCQNVSMVVHQPAFNYRYQ